MLTTIIVDDECLARENLRLLLTTFCEAIEIVAEVSTVDDAIHAIATYNPQLVFLDIEMPEKNGFQLFKAFKDIKFQIIFVTAYQRYAIKAFQVSALDYLLKPVEIDLLQKAVEKAKKHFNAQQQAQKLALLDANKNAIKKIVVPYQRDFVILDIEAIECIEASRMYSVLYTQNAKTHVSAKTLQYYENLLEANAFVRVHRSWLVNINAIQVYSKTEKLITLTNKVKVPVSRGFKTSFETRFKM